MSLNELRDKLLRITDDTLKYARSMSIPSAEIYVYNQNTTNLTDNKGKVDSRIGLVQGIGIRVADGKKLGFASSTSFDEESLKITLQKAYDIAKVSPENPLFNGLVAETKTSKEGILDEEIVHVDPEKLSE